jgi:hypothetical protein
MNLVLTDPKKLDSAEENFRLQKYFFFKLDNVTQNVLLGTRKTGQMCHSVVKISKPYLSYS